MIEALAERLPFYFSVSVTTRQRRPGEEEGVDYHFIDRSRFMELREAGDLLEWAEYNRHLYGTPRRPVEEQLALGRDVLLNVEVEGALQAKAAYPEAFTIFLVPPSWDELERRLRGRGDTNQGDAEARLQIARWELGMSDRFDHCVVVEQLEQAVGAIMRILGHSPASPEGPS